MTEIIIGVYKITNTVTGDFYIGSSKNVKSRWADHKCPSTWKNNPNKQLYQDMQEYGVDKFELQVIEEVEADKLKETEQQFIELLKPTYNQMNAKGLDVERRKEYQKEYYQQNRETHIEHQIEYYQQNRDKCKEYQKEYNNRYTNQLCFYNGETLTLNALRQRFGRSGVAHPTAEAKKYLLKKEQEKAIEFYDIYP